MAILQAIAPFFIVKSIHASVSFYVEKLGFEVEYMAPDETPFFAIVGRDHISLFLKEIAAHIAPTPNHSRHSWARWDAFIYTEDPDDYYEELVAKGLDFHQPLRDTPDGLRGFEVYDADGYVLFVGKPRGLAYQ